MAFKSPYDHFLLYLKKDFATVITHSFNFNLLRVTIISSKFGPFRISSCLRLFRCWVRILHTHKDFDKKFGYIFLYTTAE